VSSDEVTGPPKTPPAPRRLLAGLGLGVFSYSTTQMMVVPTLPSMFADLHADPARGVWVVSAFMLSTSLTTPLLGQLGDVIGRAKVLLVALALAAMGSVLGMTAPSLAVLVVARVLQGAGGAVFPLAFGQAREVLPPAKVPTAVGLISGGFGIGGSVGLVISGPLSDLVSWRAVFGVSLVLGSISLWCVLPTRHASKPSRERRLDWRGALVVALGFGCVLLAISEGSRLGWLTASVPLALFGALVLGLWWRRARWQDDAILDVRGLADGAIWPVHVLATALGLCMAATGFLVPLYVQAADGLGAGVTTSSLVLLPALLSGLGTGYAAGRLSRRTPAIPLMLGIVIMAAGYLGLALSRDEAWQVAVGAFFAHGVGMNLVLSSLSGAVTVNAPADRISEAAGVNAAARTLGGAAGSQVAALLVGGSLIAGQAGYTAAFALLAGVMLVASTTLLALRRPVRPSRPGRAPEA